jgi:hypothetical protein
MKKAVWILILIQINWFGLSQVTESKSKLLHIKMSKNPTVLKNEDRDAIIFADNIPPEIIVQVPAIRSDSLTRSEMSTLFIKGRVLDAGGISSVFVNSKPANLSPDGQFMAEVLQSTGRNTIVIMATDKANNKTSLRFYSEWLNKPTSEPVLFSSQISGNKSTINITQPSGSLLTTADNKVTLMACIYAASPIIKLLIYRDDSFVTAYPASQIVSAGNCSFVINEPVPLKFGFNEIKIEVFTNNDTVRKSIFVDYSLYEARNYALLIANENYDDSKIMDLSEPLKDATALYNVLTRQYNFDTTNVKMLKNPTKSEIIGTLHKLRSQIGASDNLLIFYAGHGIWDAEMQMGYWLPRDAHKDNPVNWLPNTDLTNYIGAIKSKHTLIIADACFSGGIFKTSRTINKDVAIEMLYEMNSRKAITSGTLSEVPDRSVFFQFLIKNLTENPSEFISSSEIFSRMREAVINNSGTVPQFGTIQNVGDEGGDFIFIKRRLNNN